MADKYFRGQGKVLIRATSGSNDSLRYVGNCSELMFNTNETFQEHQESYTGERRTDLRFKTQTQVTITVTMENTIKENWQLALKGSTTAQAGATVTAESHTAPAVGNYFALNKKYVTTLTSITSDPSGTTFVAGTDYVHEGTSNLIYVPAGSALAGDAILVNYTAGAADIVSSFNATATDYYLYFDGLNTVDSNKPVVVEAFKVSLNTTQQIALISDNLTQLQLQGTILYDPAYDVSGGADFGGFFKITQA